MINGIQHDTFIPMWINSPTALSNEVSSGLFLCCCQLHFSRYLLGYGYEKGSPISELNLMFTYSSWANGGPRAPPPPPMILREWYHFKMAAAKSEISNISEITPCRIMIWGSKTTFPWSRNQINTLDSMSDHHYVCRRTKTIKKSKMVNNFTPYFSKCFITSVLVAIKRWFWRLNLSFHVWGFQ